MNSMQHNGTKNRILAFVGFILWLAVSILCLLLFLYKHLLGLVIATFSHCFLVVGLLLIKYTRPQKVRGRIKISMEFLIGLFVTYLGGGSALLGIIYQICNVKTRESVLRMFPVFFSSVFSVYGLCLIFESVYRLIYRKKYITQSVDATVIKIERSTYSGSDSGGSGVAPTWSYDLNGIRYERKQDFYSYRCRCKQGQIMQIKVNPDEPTEIDGGNETPFMQILVGAAFIVMGVYASIICFYNIFAQN